MIDSSCEANDSFSDQDLDSFTKDDDDDSSEDDEESA
jgi:hypothetical protein